MVGNNIYPESESFHAYGHDLAGVSEEDIAATRNLINSGLQGTGFQDILEEENYLEKNGICRHSGYCSDALNKNIFNKYCGNNGEDCGKADVYETAEVLSGVYYE